MGSSFSHVLEFQLAANSRVWRWDSVLLQIFRQYSSKILVVSGVMRVDRMYESDHGESQWGDSVQRWLPVHAFGQAWAWATVAGFSLVCHVSSLLQLPVESWCHKVPRYIPQGMASPASLHHRCEWEPSDGGCVQSWFSTRLSARLLCNLAALRHKEGMSPSCSHKPPLRGFRGCL